MKKAIYGSISVLALALATPALAQTSGTVNVGGGIGAGLGGFTNGSLNTLSANGTNTQSISIDVDRNISASSGSGFGGTMDINSLPAGSSFAVVGGVGQAVSTISASVDAENNGSITTSSFNAGLYGGLTTGNAALSMQVMNFGQSSAEFQLTSSFDAGHQDEFQLASTDWTAAGAAGATLFAFGSLGWDVN